jgi:hypothetical protein
MFKACHNGDTVRGNLEDIRQAAIAAAVARERYKWELLTNQVLSDAEAQGVLSEWWEPMQAAIRNGD